MAWLRSARCSLPSSLTTDSSSTTILLPRPQKQVCLAHFWANLQLEFILYKLVSKMSLSILLFQFWWMNRYWTAATQLGKNNIYDSFNSAHMSSVLWSNFFGIHLIVCQLYEYGRFIFLMLYFKTMNKFYLTLTQCIIV